MGKDIPWVPIVLVVLAGAYFLIPSVQTSVNGFFSGAGTGTQAVNTVNTGAGNICVYDGATMTIGPMSDRWSPGTSVTNKGARVFVNGVDRGVKADSSTLNVNYGDRVEIFYAENASSGEYYTAKSSFTVPCSSAFASADQDDAEKIMPSESTTNNMSVVFFNTNNGNVNTAIGSDASDNQTINSGDTKTMKFEYQPTYQDAWSPLCQGVVVAEGNLSAYDKLEFVGWEPTSIPSQHTLDATSNKGWAYKVPLIALPTTGSYPVLTGSFFIDAASVDVGAANYIKTTWYDCDWFLNSKTGTMQQGTEDDNYADVGRGNFLVYITVK